MDKTDYYKKLEEIGKASGRTVKDVLIIATQYLNNDTKLMKQIKERGDMEVAMQQNKLMNIQYFNEQMNQQLLQFALQKKLRKMRRIEKFKNIFKTKKDETKPNKGINP